MNRIIIIFFLILFPFPSWSQDQVELPRKGFFYTTSISFAYVSEGAIWKYDINSYSIENLDFSHIHFGLESNVMVHYFIIPKRLSLGSGLGIVRYSPVKTVSLPFIFDIRGHFIRKDYGFYPFFRIGRSLPISESFRSAFLANIGLGYQFLISEKLCAAEINWRAGRTSLNNQPMRFGNPHFAERDGVHFTFSMHLFTNRK